MCPFIFISIRQKYVVSKRETGAAYTECALNVTREYFKKDRYNNDFYFLITLAVVVASIGRPLGPDLPQSLRPHIKRPSVTSSYHAEYKECIHQEMFILGRVPISLHVTRLKEFPVTTEFASSQSPELQFYIAEMQAKYGYIP